MSEFRKSLLISFLNKYSILLITIVSSMIIARLLTPSEIGLFSVAASMIGIAHALRDFGISNYLIQTKELTLEKTRTAFTLTTIMAWLIAAGLFFSRNAIALFYQKPDLADILAILALNFIILPFSSITVALLKRDMRFGKIYWITLIGSLCQAGTTLLLAWQGYSFYSLAWGGVANVLATAIAAQLLLAEFAHFRLTLAGWKPMVDFGGKLSISSLANEAGNYSPDIVIGKILDFTAVGFYSRAMGFVSLIEHTLTDAIRPVLLPHFSREHRENRALNLSFLKIANLYLAVVLPLLALIALLAYPMIRILYGNQWDQAVPLAQILCLAMAFKSLNFLMSSVILAMGQAGRVMRAQLLYQLVKITAILYGALHGLVVIAQCLVIVEILGFFIFFSKLRGTDISFIKLVGITTKNAILALLVMALPVWVCLKLANPGLIEQFSWTFDSLAAVLPTLFLFPDTAQPENILITGATSLTMAICWLLIFLLFHQELRKELIGLIKFKKTDVVYEKTPNQ